MANYFQVFEMEKNSPADSIKQESALTLFYVYDPCEPNYTWALGRAELSGVLTSFAFFITWLCGRLMLKRVLETEQYRTPITMPERRDNSPFPTKSPLDWIKQCLDSLLIVVVCSTIHHACLTYPTQFVDELSVIQAQLSYVFCFSNLSKKEWTFVAICVALGLFHGVFPGAVIFYLFYYIGDYTIQLCKEYPELFSKGVIILTTNIFAIVVGVLDYFLCPKLEFLKLHSLAHISLAIYCFFGAMLSLEVKLKRINQKKEPTDQSFSADQVRLRIWKESQKNL